ncbi:uncharacterized protein LOC143376767 [Andrena cerasifolii]|uniref:uncharacterized protein LOC143376767 n=1 Tax=Andrena cerasifolii TaxID=2819439 RepID=UPI0040376FAB
MFSAQECYAMFWVYARNNGETNTTVRVLAREYPRIETPSEGTIRRLASRLHSTGSMMPRGSDMGRREHVGRHKRRPNRQRARLEPPPRYQQNDGTPNYEGKHVASVQLSPQGNSFWDT